MPVIIFEGGLMDGDKKKELICELTDAAAKTTGIRPEAFIVCIHESPSDNVGVGGECLTEVLARAK
ncbi:MAG: tautomerase family protein [Pseudomonadota bacterium]|jgi:4-oxalocrotonate tautomerase family enzyme